MSIDISSIKEEPPMDMDEEDIEPPAFAAALGLHRVGTVFPPKPQSQQPIQVLNARGMPARIRKKNKLFFDDDIINERPQRTSPVKKLLKPALSTLKTPSKILKKRKGVVSKYMKSKEETKSTTPEPPSPVRPPSPPPPIIEQIDRKVGQTIGLRLRNLLKLPKAHKWVSYEWFYSYIDKSLFEGENDFQICLRESFPQLKTRNLTRIEWSKIRKLMGKPRRCSQSFFEEERRELERRRQKIRFLQSRKSGDLSLVKDLPHEIPLQLPVGTKVTARLRHPQDGIFTGTIDAIDSLSSIYRITFDRPGLGTHSVPDYEVIANEFVDTISLNSITQDVRSKLNGPYYSPHRKGPLSSLNKSDPLLGSEIYNNHKFKNLILPKETIGGFQLKLLEIIIRTKKTLSAKQLKLLRLKNMNSEAETYISYGEEFPDDYQRRYAGIVISMDKLNRDMHEYLNQILIYTKDMKKEPHIAAMLAPSYLREKCKEIAAESVQKNNQVIKDESMLQLINDLATIMWITSNLTNDNQNPYVLKVLEGYLEEAKSRLDPKNVAIFLKNVNVHIRHIELDLGESSLNSTN